MVDLTGARSRIVHIPLPQDDPVQRCPDIARTEQVLGWRPGVVLQDEPRRIIAHFERLLTDREAALGRAGSA